MPVLPKKARCAYLNHVLVYVCKHFTHFIRFLKKYTSHLFKNRVNFMRDTCVVKLLRCLSIIQVAIYLHDNIKNLLRAVL